ncbi:hypothetical protein BKA63DRAFT_306746 [Paraphoma chrysanthemicola]|nr:hypothetical protein BKA63DRAFT_306746 [Paraphoma chrysanthemicola]
MNLMFDTAHTTMSSRRRSLSVDVRSSTSSIQLTSDNLGWDGYTLRTGGDSGKIASLSNAINELRTLHDVEHPALEKILQNSPYHDLPSVTSTLQSLNEKYAEAEAMIQEFTESLEQRKVAIQDEMDTVLLEIARNRDWWDNVDILASDYPNAMIDKLFDFNEPEDPVAYGRSIKRMISTTTARLNDLRLHEFEQFSNRAYREIVRISDMRNGGRIALELFVDLAVDIPPLDSNWAGASFYLDMHHDIRGNIATILAETDKLQEIHFYGLANACRRVRTRMLQKPCEWDDPEKNHYGHNTCLYNTFLPLLDLMQRYAYFEIRSIARRALGARLPEELFRLVLDRTLAAEGIGTDPRVLAVAASQDGPVRTKCLLPCEHDLRSPYSLPSGDNRYRFVHDSRYDVFTPNFPHSVASYSSLVQLEYRAAFPDTTNPFAAVEQLENLNLYPNADEEGISGPST